MKKIFMAIIVIAIASTTYAQKNSDSKFVVSLGAELGFATGDFNKTHSVGIGATLQGELNVATNTNATITTGFLTYKGKSVTIAGLNLKYSAANIIPIKAGLKYFFTEGGGFYGAAQAGIGIFNNNGGSAFAYTPMIGYEFNTNSGKAVDASFKYDGYSKSGSSLGSVGVRLAYKF